MSGLRNQIRISSLEKSAINGFEIYHDSNLEPRNFVTEELRYLSEGGRPWGGDAGAGSGSSC